LATGSERILDQAVIDEFRVALRGDLIVPGSNDYEARRRVWNLTVDKHPALIVRCAGAMDVITSIQFARTHGLITAVRGGGHNPGGKSTCDGGLVLDMSLMKSVRVDRAKKTARADAGLLLGEFDHETQAFGLATTLGVAPDTGISGLTLGGGYGWLEGKHGLACDNLLSVDIVTADGNMTTASESENADLFWAVRGAGANFGVVTSFEYRLHDLRTVTAGLLIYEFSRAREVLSAYNNFSKMVPDEVSCVVGLGTTPDGNKAVIIAPCFSGPPGEADKALEPLRANLKPAADFVQPMPYLAAQKLLAPLFPIGYRYYWKGSLIQDLSDSAIEVLLDFASRAPTPLSAIGFQQIHGAAARVPMEHTAFPHRFPHHDFFPTAIWSDPAQDEECTRWSRECWEAMQPFVERANYVNDLGDETDERVEQAYGANYGRLVELKRKFDPANLFRLNQNIRP
jgi:FAD/FMN-containing dehydrogenase